MKIRVLQVVSGLDYGGIEIFLKNMLEHLPKDELEVSILCTSPQRGKLEDFFERHCTVYHLASDKSRRERKKGRIEFFKTHKNEFDIVHIHTVYCTCYSIAKIAKKYQNCKVIVHSHIASDYSFSIKVLNRLTRGSLNRYTDIALGCSRNSAQFLFGEKRGQNAVIINNGIDGDTFAFDESTRQRVRDEFHIPNDCFVMGTVGRMSHQKNHLYLIDIFNSYHELNAQSKLLLVGDGDCREETERKVDSLQLRDSVIFAGSRGDISDMLQAMDCFMLPSFFEGLAISAVEAQANGLKCYISDAVTKDIDLNGTCVFLSVQENPTVWANAVHQGDNNRILNDNLLQDTGFDIKQSAMQLWKVYKRAYEESAVAVDENGTHVEKTDAI